MFNMTPNLIRNFLAERATRRHPFDVRPPFPGARGEIENSAETCIFCGVCAMKCPSQCLSVDKKAQTWEWNPFACVYCGICTESCPKQSLHQKTAYRKPVTEKATVCMKGETESSQISENLDNRSSGGISGINLISVSSMYLLFVLLV